MTDTCKSCEALLTSEERFFYLDRCEACETRWHERIQAWLRGAHDPALDAGRFLDMPEVH
ncbi:hypothetical protein DFO67_108166 [Modicisalibacter xianhensis]|uniref:Uncharacterized protein n=1 Tax=Modicisalibacter xianhensis TaxID=442341 RepID=A0A4R8FZM3_9GAMM|nr:hypothetical protein [Halomonas xianhensis]TDX29122.1 hypothetical protein DFO67_108166 [Halomonas xianhensis]